MASKYRVERVLGKGGMGVVVAARHLELGELYAIKFLLPQALESPKAVERFLREARASARLKGEHVAKVHDVGRLETGAPYMVLEYLAGSDLQQTVRQRGPLPVEEAATYMLQVCEAIAEAHALGIIHRDIKPANLFLIQRPNGTPCVKVLDFGISKQTSPDQVDLTKTGTVMGSPLYMAPEQMTHTKEADARSDLWSLGVVLYKLLTGEVPFTGDTLPEVIARVLQNDPAPPSHLRPELPQAADAIVVRCLQKRPEDRFQSVHELAMALQPLAGIAGSWPGLWAAGLQPGRASYPPARSSQPEIPPPRVSRPSIRPEAAPPAEAAEIPGSPTGQTWGRTANGPSSSKRAGRRIVAAGLAALGAAAIGGAGVWFTQRPSSPSGAASQTVEAAPAAAAAMVEPADRAAPEPSIVAAPPTPAEAPSAATPPPAPEPAATHAQAGSSRSTNSKSGASGVRAASSPAPTIALSASPASKPPAPSAKPTPSPAPSAPPKPRHEGVF